jgi:hypothetical protein
MRVRFTEGYVSNELLDFLRRSDCLAERIADSIVEVSPKQAMLPEAARLEVEGLLRVWSKLHPDVRDADFLDDSPSQVSASAP